MKHDQLWKEVLLTFLREFLELFFPEVAERIDFNGIVPLDKEVFTDTPDGELREPDLVVQGFGAALVDAEADRGEDPVAVFADRFAELDERRKPAAGQA